MWRSLSKRSEKVIVLPSLFQVASITVIHVPDDKYSISARLLFQYLLTSQGSMYELKVGHVLPVSQTEVVMVCYSSTSCLLQPLFMSADSGGGSGPPDWEQSPTPSEATEEACGVEQSLVLEEDESSLEGMSRDCVVCQNAAVNKVLLPCRHTCVCDSCVPHLQHCPICRAFVLESFALTQGAAVDQ